VIVGGLSDSNVQLTKEDIEPPADHDEAVGKDICDVVKSENTAAEVAYIPQVAEPGEVVITKATADKALAQSALPEIKDVDLVPSEREVVQKTLASASLNTASGADTVDVIPKPVEAKVASTADVADSKPLKTKRRLKTADAGKSSKSKSKPWARLKVEPSEKLPSPPLELLVQDVVVAPEAEAPAGAPISVEVIEVSSEEIKPDESLASTASSVTDVKIIVHEHVDAGGEGRETEIAHKEMVSEATDPSFEPEKAAVTNVGPEAAVVAAEDVHEHKSLEKHAHEEVGEEPSVTMHSDSSETTKANVLSPEPATGVVLAEGTKLMDGNILELAGTGPSVEGQAELSSRNGKTLPKKTLILPGTFPEEKVPQGDSLTENSLEDSLAEVPQIVRTAEVRESSTGYNEADLAEEIEEPFQEAVATGALEPDLPISNKEITANEQPAEADTIPLKDATTSTDHPVIENPSQIKVEPSPEGSAAPADRVAFEPLPTSAEAGSPPADSQPPPSPTLSKKSSPKSARSSNSLRRSDHWTRPARPKNVSSKSKPEREKSPTRRATIAFSSRGIFRKSAAADDDDDRTVEWARRIRREATEAAEEEAKRERKESRRVERIREELRLTKDTEERRVRHEKRREERVKEVEALLGERRAEERKMRERADERGRNEEADRRRRRRDRERERANEMEKEKENETEQAITRDAELHKSTASRRHRSGTTTSSSQTRRRHRSDEERKKKDGPQPVADAAEKAASTTQGAEHKADASSSNAGARREGDEARQGKGGRSERQDGDGDAARRSRRREERNGGRSWRREEEEVRERKREPPRRGLFSGWRKVLLPL